MKRNIFIFNILLTVILTMLISCEMEQKGTLVINLPGSSNERTAFSAGDINKLDLSFNISYAGSDGNGSRKNIPAGSSVSINVSAGKWDVTVDVLDVFNNKIGEQTKSMNVIAGKSNIINFSIPINIICLRASKWEATGVNDPAGSNWSSQESIRVDKYYKPDLKINETYMVEISGYASVTMDAAVVGFKHGEKNFITDEYKNYDGVKIQQGERFSQQFKITVNNSYSDQKPIYLDIMNKVKIDGNISNGSIMAYISDFNMVIYRQISFDEARSSDLGLLIDGLSKQASAYKVKLFENNSISSASEARSNDGIAYGKCFDESISRRFLLTEEEYTSGDEIYVWEGTGLYTIVLIDTGVRKADNVMFINGKADIIDKDGKEGGHLLNLQ